MGIKSQYKFKKYQNEKVNSFRKIRKFVNSLYGIMNTRKMWERFLKFLVATSGGNFMCQKTMHNTSGTYLDLIYDMAIAIVQKKLLLSKLTEIYKESVCKFLNCLYVRMRQKYENL